MPQPDLSVIIVNYHSMPELGKCLSSLVAVRNECSFEAIVVDNGSEANTLEKVVSEYPWCRAISLGENRGFAAACNAGLESAAGRHAMLLNPDAEVLPGALPKLVLALDDHPAWGIVGPVMIEHGSDSSHAYPSARRFPTPWFLFWETTGLARLFPHSARFNGYLYGEREPKSLDEVDQIEGSALVISEAARKKVGNLDPQFFLFFEEVDWCRRVREAGFEIHVVPDAVIRHKRSSTMSRFFVASRIHHAESALKYFRKHNGESGPQRLRRAMCPALTLRLLILWFSLLLKNTERNRMRFEGTKAMRKVYRTFTSSSLASPEAAP